MYVLVTVGSTSFDDLVSTVVSPSVLRLLADNGMSKMVLQVGRGKLPPQLADEGVLQIKERDDEAGIGIATHSGLIIKWFRFSPELFPTISEAALVIGHAGAGTVLESLTAGTPLVCVINERLLHNHQGELAEQMASEGLLRYCTCNLLGETLREHFGEPKCNGFVSEPYMFSTFLEDFMGLR